VNDSSKHYNAKTYIVQVLSGAGYLAYLTSNIDGLTIEQHVFDINSGKQLS
jgi:hypothetical protein